VVGRNNLPLSFQRGTSIWRKRIRLAQIPHALKYILWDGAARRLISVAEFEQQAVAAAA
jgi:hypothetical protein